MYLRSYVAGAVSNFQHIKEYNWAMTFLQVGLPQRSKIQPANFVPMYIGTYILNAAGYCAPCTGELRHSPRKPIRSGAALLPGQTSTWVCFFQPFMCGVPIEQGQEKKNEEGKG